MTNLPRYITEQLQTELQKQYLEQIDPEVFKDYYTEPFESIQMICDFKYIVLVDLNSKTAEHPDVYVCHTYVNTPTHSVFRCKLYIKQEHLYKSYVTEKAKIRLKAMVCSQADNLFPLAQYLQSIGEGSGLDDE